MILSFTLSMPGVNSWNGRWSGERQSYVITKSFTGKAGIEKARKVLASAPYYYDWPDGWGAKVSVAEVTPAEARRLRKASSGFCGYDWMVTRILEYGKILADHELPTKASLQPAESVT